MLLLYNGKPYVSSLCWQICFALIKLLKQKTTSTGWGWHAKRGMSAHGGIQFVPLRKNSFSFKSLNAAVEAQTQVGSDDVDCSLKQFFDKRQPMPCVQSSDAVTYFIHLRILATCSKQAQFVSCPSKITVLQPETVAKLILATCGVLATSCPLQ